MQTRETSIAAFLKMKENKLLSPRRLMVYEAICHLQPATQGEIAKWLQRFHPHLERPSITPRFAEMKRLGVITEQEERKCNVSGEPCLTWIVTGTLPVENPSKRKTGKQVLEDARLAHQNLLQENIRLTDENFQLKRQLGNGVQANLLVDA